MMNFNAWLVITDEICLHLIRNNLQRGVINYAIKTYF